MVEGVDAGQEREDRAESLRLTLLAIPIEAHSLQVPQLAHWVHAGQELPDPLGARPGPCGDAPLGIKTRDNPFCTLDAGHAGCHKDEVNDTVWRAIQQA